MSRRTTRKATTAAPRAKATESSVKEKTLSDLVAKYIYAALDDIRSDWNGDDLYPKEVYQHYTFVCEGHKNAAKLRKSMFTIAAEVKQIYFGIFNAMVAEIGLAEIKIGDTLAKMRQQIADANVDCMSVVVIDIAEQYMSKFGKVLNEAIDPHANIVARANGQLATKHGSVMAELSLVWRSFDNFLKATAWFISKQVWYSSVSINLNYINSVLLLIGFDQTMVDLIAGFVRAKEKKVKARPNYRDPAMAKLDAEASKSTPPTVEQKDKILVPQVITPAPSSNDRSPTAIQQTPSPVKVAEQLVEDDLSEDNYPDSDLVNDEQSEEDEQLNEDELIGTDDE